MTAATQKPNPRRIASRIVWRFGLQDLVFRVRELLLAAKGDLKVKDAGFPVPNALLRVLVSGTADWATFRDGGRAIVEEFERELRKLNSSFEAANEILDIGCGCGRLARWVLQLNKRVVGVDINPSLIRWSKKNLPGQWFICELHKAMPLESGRFDVAYACSIMTHLREATAKDWLSDAARVMRKGGHLIVTFHDEHHPSAAPLLEEISRGYAVRFDSLEGSNQLAAYCSIHTFRQIVPPELELVAYTPGNETMFGQAISIWQRQ